MEECIYVGDRLHTDALASRQFAQNRFLGVWLVSNSNRFRKYM
jgi:predicted HAD superfamily phosphohydrolase YqeG